MLVLNIMVNEFTCNHIVRSDSILIVSIFWKKKLVKIGWHYIVSYMCNIACIESVFFFFPGLRRQLKIFTKKFIFQCVNS